MANESFSFEEAFGPPQKSQPGSSAGDGSFSFEEALGHPVQASPGFIPTIKRTGGQMLTSAATSLEDVTGPNVVTRAVHDAGQGIIDRNPAGIRSLRDLVDSPWLAVKESVGQIVPQFAAMGAGGVAGARLGASIAGPAGAVAGSAIGGLAPIFTQEYGGIRQEQKESGQEDKGRALMAAIPATALERVGMGKALKVLKGVPGGAAGTVLKEAGKGVLKEGATEGAQNVIEQWGAFKDPTTGENLEDTALAAAMGGIGGGVMGGASGAVDGVRRRAQERAQAQAEQQASQNAEAAAADAQAKADALVPPWTTEAGATDPTADASAGLPDVRAYGPLIEQAIKPELQERFRNLLDSATNAELSQEQRDAAADELHSVFSPERLEQRRQLDAGTDFTTTPGAAAPRDGGVDFTRDVDTSGLSLEDPAEAERARAATIDYQPGDTTPQWGTAPGAAPERQGMDMPGPDFGTEGLALEPDPRTPSQRTGIDPGAGPLSRNVAAALDRGDVQEAQFMGASGRELQVRRSGPGMMNESNVIDVQGRVIEDRALGMAQGTATRAAGQLPMAAETPAPINPTGEPLRLDMAHALRQQARDAGVRAAVVRHASGRGYDVVPQLPAPATQAAPPVVATPTGAPFATRAAAQAELQRQQLTSTHDVAPAGGDQSLGFVLQARRPNAPAGQQMQAPAAIEAVAQRAPNWRTNAMQANRVARAMGLDTKGKRLAQVVAEIDAADAQRAGVHQDGNDLSAGQIDSEWSAFAPETGTLGVPRAAMPQIKAEHRGALVNFLKARGIDSRAGEVPANDLKPTQAEFSPSKVEKARAFQGGDRSILVSSDGYVVDGHHQWLAKRANGEPVKVIRLQAPIRKVLAQTAEFPSTASARGAAADPMTPQERAAWDARHGITPERRAEVAAKQAAIEQQNEQTRNSRIKPEASTTVPSTKNATETVAAGADVQSAGGGFDRRSGGAQRPTSPAPAAPRQEATQKLAQEHAAQAQDAAKIVADSAAEPQRGARAAAPRPSTKIKDFGETKPDDGTTVLYSTSSEAPPARGLSVEQAQKAVQQALAGFMSPPPIDIVLRGSDLGPGTPDGVMGAAIPSEGRIVIVATAHRNVDAVVETLFHEMFHLGVRNVLPASDYVQAMLDLAKRDSRVQEYANRWKKDSADAPQQLQVLRDLGHTGSDLTAWYEALAIEEGLAVVAEELRAQKQAGTRLGLRVRALAGWLANVAERMGMQRLADSIRKMTYNEAERFVMRAIEHAGRAPLAQGVGGDNMSRYRTQGSNAMAQRVGDALAGLAVTDLRQQAAFKAADLRPLGLQFLGRRQLVDVYGGMLPELRTYSDLMARMDADKNEAGAGADQLATDWAKLPDERQLAELMHDATLAQMDPARDYVDGDNRVKYGELHRRFEALSSAARDVYTRARDTYRQHMRDVRAAIKERIERAEMSSERRAAMLKRLDDEFFGHIKGAYFPLARFGQYVVVVKGADGKVANVSRAETMAEADTMRRQLLAAFPQAEGFTVGKVLKAKDFVAERDSVGRGFMEQLYGVLDKQGMAPQQRAELEDALGQLYLSSLPDLSWAKHGIHRKGTPGFSQDARRAFAQNVFHGASYLAKLRYGDQLQDQLAEMQKRVDAGASDGGFDSVKAQQVVDEMAKRHDAAMNPKTNALSTALTSLGFMFHLGLSPASAMVNLTQTALVAYPVMGARWGFSKASAALLKASQEAVRGKNDITGSLSQDEKAAFEEAVRSGVVDVTMAHDLAGIAQGEDRSVSYKLRPVMRAASFLFHHAEKFNRQVTFVAAYRLAREAGADPKNAYQQAVQATYDGHFDYSANNRPRVMQGNVARVLLLFKQHGQNMVYTLARSAQQSLKGATPEERTQARKALAGLLTMHAMAAGVLGLPMVTTLLSAASMLGGDDDEPWDAKVALQNLLADTFGQKPAEVLSHGLSRLTPWDISGRVGLDKLIFPDVQEGLEGQRLGESAMAAALGPVAAIGINALKGLQEMSEGRYQRGLETMAPSVLRGPLKALRYESEGVKDKSGIVVQDEVGAAALLGQAAGFSPSSVRNAYEGKAAIVGHDRALQARRSALVEQFAMAAMAKDDEGKAEAREAIQRFNEKNPGRRILPMQLAQSVHQRDKRIREAEDGVYLPKKRRDVLEQGRFAVGE